MTTNNDHAAAVELWDAMGEVEGLRPDEITLHRESWYYDSGDGTGGGLMEDSHALFILTGHAERWLRERGWTPSKYWNRYNPPNHNGVTDYMLIAAIRAEASETEHKTAVVRRKDSDE